MNTLQTRGRVTVKRAPDDTRLLLVSVELQVPGLGTRPRFLIHDEPIELKEIQDSGLAVWLRTELERT